MRRPDSREGLSRNRNRTTANFGLATRVQPDMFRGRVPHPNSKDHQTGPYVATIPISSLNSASLGPISPGGSVLGGVAADQNIPGPTKAFEAPGVNDLWIVDFSPGPFLSLHPKAVATHLCVIIDDHSRLIPHAAYARAADTQALLGCLKEAIRRRGLPRKLYCDNGGPFVNNHLKIVCANLGIRLVHSKPGKPWSRGKVERLFRTLQQDFEAGLRLPGQGVGSLEELNGKLARWLQEVYHPRVHDGIGESPQDRFARALPLLRPLDPQLDLDRLFYTRIDRVVRKDGTVRIDNDLYEVNLALRGLQVQLELDPWVMNPILVRYKGQDFGAARKVDRHLNSQIDGGRSSHE